MLSKNFLISHFKTQQVLTLLLLTLALWIFLGFGSLILKA